MNGDFAAGVGSDAFFGPNETTAQVAAVSSAVFLGISNVEDGNVYGETTAIVGAASGVAQNVNVNSIDADLGAHDGAPVSGDVDVATNMHEMNQQKDAEDLQVNEQLLQKQEEQPPEGMDKHVEKVNGNKMQIENEIIPAVVRSGVLPSSEQRDEKELNPVETMNIVEEPKVLTTGADADEIIPETSERTSINDEAEAQQLSPVKRGSKVMAENETDGMKHIMQPVKKTEGDPIDMDGRVSIVQNGDDSNNEMIVGENVESMSNNVDVCVDDSKLPSGHLMDNSEKEDAESVKLKENDVNTKTEHEWNGGGTVEELDEKRKAQATGEHVKDIKEVDSENLSDEVVPNEIQSGSVESVDAPEKMLEKNNKNETESFHQKCDTNKESLASLDVSVFSGSVSIVAPALHQIKSVHGNLEDIAEVNGIAQMDVLTSDNSNEANPKNINIDANGVAIMGEGLVVDKQSSPKDSPSLVLKFDTQASVVGKPFSTRDGEPTNHFEENIQNNKQQEEEARSGDFQQTTGEENGSSRRIDDDMEKSVDEIESKNVVRVCSQPLQKIDDIQSVELEQQHEQQSSQQMQSSSVAEEGEVKADRSQGFSALSSPVDNSNDDDNDVELKNESDYKAKQNASSFSEEQNEANDEKNAAEMNISDKKEDDHHSLQNNVGIKDEHICIKTDEMQSTIRDSSAADESQRKEIDEPEQHVADEIHQSHIPDKKQKKDSNSTKKQQKSENNMIEEKPKPKRKPKQKRPKMTVEHLRIAIADQESDSDSSMDDGANVVENEKEQILQGKAGEVRDKTNGTSGANTGNLVQVDPIYLQRARAQRLTKAEKKTYKHRIYCLIVIMDR